jgi:hypothetical protein
VSDWQVGDLALCVNAAKDAIDTRLNPALEERRTYRVERLGEVSDYFCLGLEGLRDPDDNKHFAYRADRFRKILPDEHEDCEPEFVTLLNRIKRKVEA